MGLSLSDGTLQAAAQKGPFRVEWVKKNDGNLPWAHVSYKGNEVMVLDSWEWFALYKLMEGGNNLNPYGD